MKLAASSGPSSRPSTPPLRRPHAPALRPARPGGEPSGGYLIAVDTVGAGAGETVLLLDEGNSARQVLAAPGAPIRTVVVGIVDEVTGAEVSS